MTPSTTPTPTEKSAVVGGWRSTLVGVAILVFLAFVIWREPTHLKEPESMITLASGLYAILRCKE